MIRDRVFYDFEQLFLRIGRADREPMEQLHHEASKPFEGTRYAYCRTYLDQNSFCRVNVDLKLPGLVDGGIQQSKEALEKT